MYLKIRKALQREYKIFRRFFLIIYVSFRAQIKNKRGHEEKTWRMPLGSRSVRNGMFLLTGSYFPGGFMLGSCFKWWVHARFMF